MGRYDKNVGFPNENVISRDIKFEDSLDVAKYTLNVHAESMKKDISSDYVMASYDVKDKEFIVDMYDTSKRIYYYILDLGAPYKKDYEYVKWFMALDREGKAKVRKMPTSFQVKNYNYYLIAISKAQEIVSMFKNKMDIITATSRNKKDNWQVGAILGALENLVPNNSGENEEMKKGFQDTMKQLLKRKPDKEGQ